MKKFEEILAENITKYRQRAGLTQRELASKAKLHWTTVNRIEKGRQPPRMTNIEAIAVALGCSKEDLFKGPASKQDQSTQTEEMLELWLRADDVTRETVLNLLRPAHVSQKERKS